MSLRMQNPSKVFFREDVNFSRASNCSPESCGDTHWQIIFRFADWHTGDSPLSQWTNSRTSRKGFHQALPGLLLKLALTGLPSFPSLSPEKKTQHLADFTLISSWTPQIVVLVFNSPRTMDFELRTFVMIPCKGTAHHDSNRDLRKKHVEWYFRLWVYKLYLEIWLFNLSKIAEFDWKSGAQLKKKILFEREPFY